MRRKLFAHSLFALLIAAIFTAVSLQAAETKPTTGDIGERIFKLLDRNPQERAQTLKWLTDRGRPDAVAALIQLKRFDPDNRDIDKALAALSGNKNATTWHEWILWQEAHPEIKPFGTFDTFKATALSFIDRNFGLFLYRDVKHEIRLEEIVWGGVVKDGIPALTNPELVATAKATYLTDDELVFGVAINGDARAYPLRILDWHEMFNDVIGGVPVSLAYCTLCGSGILFETTVEGREKPFVFGSSGFLYRSNKLMYDRQTHSLWNQFTGRPVVGKLSGSGIELKTRPVVITSWKAWRDANPKTKVLSLKTGHNRDYLPGAPYGHYFSSPDLMFPAIVKRKDLKPKDYVFALRSSGAERAWPLSAFEGGRVINDRAGTLEIVLIGDAATRSVRAYRSGGRIFKAAGKPDTVSSQDTIWHVREDALHGPAGEKLHRLPGHIAYWFAWAGYLGDKGTLATTK